MINDADDQNMHKIHAMMRERREAADKLAERLAQLPVAHVIAARDAIGEYLEFDEEGLSEIFDRAISMATGAA